MKLEESSIDNILENLLKRSPNQYDTYQDTVAEILNDVKENGDKALFAYTEKFDKAVITKDTIKVTEEEIKEAYDQVDDSLIEVMKKSLANIRDFHEKQLRNSWFETREDGVILGQRVTALESVGVYVPGGKAAYPSSVLMNIIPAKVAGVKRIVMTTPPGKDGKVTPVTLVAAHLAGATEVYKVGGAQAIGALAYGTESIKKYARSAVPVTFSLRLRKRPFTDMSALTLSRDQVRSLCWLTRQQIHVMWQRIFCHRRNMTNWHLLSSLPQARILPKR